MESKRPKKMRLEAESDEEKILRLKAKVKELEDSLEEEKNKTKDAENKIEENRNKVNDHIHIDIHNHDTNRVATGCIILIMDYWSIMDYFPNGPKNHVWSISYFHVFVRCTFYLKNVVNLIEYLTILHLLRLRRKSTKLKERWTRFANWLNALCA